MFDAQCTLAASGDVVPADYFVYTGVVMGALAVLVAPVMWSVLVACLCCRTQIRVARGYSSVWSLVSNATVVQNNGRTIVTSNGGRRVTVDLNNRTYHGSRFEVDRDGRVQVDGVYADDDSDTTAQPVRYEVRDVIVRDSDLAGVRTSSADVTVYGDVQGSVTTASGDVEIAGRCTGSVWTASGDVEVGGDIGGSATATSGDIEARSAQHRRRGSRV